LPRITMVSGSRAILSSWALLMWPTAGGAISATSHVTGAELGAAEALLFQTPAEVIAAYAYQPSPTTVGAGTSTAVTNGPLPRLLELADQLGLLASADPLVRLGADAASALFAVARFPHAGVLFDVEVVERTDGGHRLSKFDAALILKTGGDFAAVDGRIQKLLNAHTHTGHTSLRTQMMDGRLVNVLRDHRLPEWAEVSWARVDDHYVIAVGARALHRALVVLTDRSRSLAARQPWAELLASAGGHEASWTLAVDFLRLRDSAGAAWKEKVLGTLEALTLDRVDRAVWTVAYHGRSCTASVAMHRDGGNVFQPIATQDCGGVSADRLVPKEAANFALIHVDLQMLVRSLARAYLRTQSSAGRDTTRAFIRKLESESGVSFERDIVDRLGSCLVVHDFPRNALHLPFLWSVQLEIQAGDVDLRSAIDKVLSVIQKRIEPPSFVRLYREQDGIWFLSLGIAGPALTVTKEGLLVSFSPYALRQFLSALPSQNEPNRTPPQEAPK